MKIFSWFLLVAGLVLMWRFASQIERRAIKFGLKEFAIAIAIGLFVILVAVFCSLNFTWKII